MLPSKPENVKVYSKEQGVILPQLLPQSLPVPDHIKCNEKFDGKVELSLLVDAEGHARNIMFIQPVGNDIDRFALKIADADRFSPGKFNEKPVTVASRLNIKIQSCLVERMDPSGNVSHTLRLRSNPVQELVPEKDFQDQTVSAPVLLFRTEAEYTREAQEAMINGKCLISFVVDTQGMPRNLYVVKSLDPGLDRNALAAVSTYRFKPAIRDGKPYPKRLTVEANFSTYRPK